MRKVGGAIAFLVVLALVIGGLAWWAARPDEPDAFYDPPAPLQAGAPGEVLRRRALQLNQCHVRPVQVDRSNLGWLRTQIT